MHSHNIRSLPAVNYSTSPRRNSLPPSSHQNSGNIQRLPIDNPKIFKDFFACRIVLSLNSSTSRIYSKTFQLAKATSSSNQQQQPAAAIRSSNQQQQSAAAINSSNQQQQSAAAISSSNQQQQSTAAISSSNQQRRLAAATSSSNQQQQSTAAINNHDQQQQSALILPAAPTQSTPTSVSYHYGS